MKREVCILAEHSQREMAAITQELVFAGRRLAEKYDLKLSALIMGHNMGNLSNFLFNNGVDKVYEVDDEKFEKYSQDLYISIISKLIKQYQPLFFIYGVTTLGMDIAPRISAKFGAGLISNVIEIEFDAQGEAIFFKPIYEGKLVTKMNFVQNGLNIITVLPGSFPSETLASTSRELVKVKLETAVEVKSRTKEVIKEESTGEMDISQAEVIVAGGRGLGGERGAELLFELTGVLDAAVGASRPAVEAGWLPYSCQVGMSGKKVSPKIYMALGISGAFQHLAGMKGSKCIIAINKDADAQIFDFADYGVISDLHKIISPLIKEVSRIRKEYEKRHAHAR